MMMAKTPKSILDDPDDGRDVFHDIFYDASDAPHWTYDSGPLYNRCWSRYMNTGIGNNDVDYWIQCMTMKVADLMDTWYFKFRAWDKYCLGIDPLHVEDIDMSSFKTESKSIHKTYDPPQTATAGDDATSYLDIQDENSFEQKDSSGLDTVTVRDYIDGIRNPYDDFLRELDRMFYWGL